MKKIGKILIGGAVVVAGFLALNGGVSDEGYFGGGGGGFFGGQDSNYTDVSKKDSNSGGSSSPIIVEAMDVPFAPLNTTSSSGTKKSTFTSRYVDQNIAFGGTLNNPIPFTTAIALEPEPVVPYGDNPTAPTIANATKKENASKYGGLYSSSPVDVSKFTSETKKKKKAEQ